MVRRSPLLKLQGDEGLVSLVRSGNPGAFESIVDRYQSRLLGFCRQMLGSTEDAEDVLQEVFVNAYKAMLADNRDINLRPWLYRIARNRCLNQLRKPTADGQETMDTVPAVDAASTHERAHNREEFRQLLRDVNKLPETQRSALLLREMDAMSYEDIAQMMETTVPSVKSLLVRARISLAEGSQARQLTCGEVRLELAEAAEGLRKVSGPVRRHVRECDECADFRSQVRSDSKALAALIPVAPLVALKGFLASKLGFGGGGAAGGGVAGAGATGSGVTAAGSAGAFGAGGAAAAGGAAGGIGAIGSALGAKAVAGVVTAAVLTAGAVEVRNQVATHDPAPTASVASAKATHAGPPSALRRVAVAAPTEIPPVAEAPPVSEPPVTATDPVPAPAADEPAAAGDSAADGSATAPVAPAEEAAPADGDAGASSSTTAVTTTTTDTTSSGEEAVVTIGTGSTSTGSVGSTGVEIGTGPVPPPDGAVTAPPLGG